MTRFVVVYDEDTFIESDYQALEKLSTSTLDCNFVKGGRFVTADALVEKILRISKTEIDYEPLVVAMPEYNPKTVSVLRTLSQYVDVGTVSYYRVSSLQYDLFGQRDWTSLSVDDIGTYLDQSKEIRARFQVIPKSRNVDPEISHPTTERDRSANIPAQSTAPIQAVWESGLLTPKRQLASELTKVTEDGRQANFEHLQEECDRLFIVLQGSNAARFVEPPLLAYKKTLGDYIETLSVLKLGHKGLALRSAIDGSIEELADHLVFGLKALVASHDLFMAQEERWTNYLAAARQDNITPKQDSATAQFSLEITRELRSSPEIIDGRLPEELDELRLDVDRSTARDFRISAYGYYKSIRNVLISLLNAAVRGIKSSTEVMASEIRKVAMARLVKAITDPLLSLASGDVSGFEWLHSVIRYLLHNPPHG